MNMDMPKIHYKEFILLRLWINNHHQSNSNNSYSIVWDHEWAIIGILLITSLLWWLHYFKTVNMRNQIDFFSILKLWYQYPARKCIN